MNKVDYGELPYPERKIEETLITEMNVTYL